MSRIPGIPHPKKSLYGNPIWIVVTYQSEIYVPVYLQLYGMVEEAWKVRPSLSFLFPNPTRSHISFSTLYTTRPPVDPFIIGRKCLLMSAQLISSCSTPGGAERTFQKNVMSISVSQKNEMIHR